MNRNKRIGKENLTCFHLSFLNVCIAKFISLFNIVSILGNNLEVGDVFATKNMPQELNSCLYQLACYKIGFIICCFA